MTLAAIWDVPAPAKLNLFLHVVGCRPDGYHLLQSVFVLIDWCDTLHFERRSDGQLRRHDLGPALPADDLSLRAARALQQSSGCALGADISVLKRVPWGAGLGGGSSDAASTLLALNRLWGLGWSRPQLQRIALPLGADVPFFVGGNTAFVEGIGERITPLPAWPAQRFVVVKPAPAIATAAIFGSPLLVRDTEPVIVMGCLTGAGWLCEIAKAGFGRNDLQPPAEASCPEVGQVARWLEAGFGNSRMTGSGSAVFARIDTNFEQSVATVAGPAQAGPGTQSTAAGEAQDFERTLPASWVGRICRSLDHHPLRAWADGD